MFLNNFTKEKREFLDNPKSDGCLGFFFLLLLLVLGGGVLSYVSF